MCNSAAFSTPSHGTWVDRGTRLKGSSSANQTRTQGLSPFTGLAQPPMSGWIRSLKKMQKLDLTADVRVEDFTKDMDVRPGVRIHFRDLEAPIELSASGLPNQKARDAVADFI